MKKVIDDNKPIDFKVMAERVNKAASCCLVISNTKRYNCQDCPFRQYAKCYSHFLKDTMIISKLYLGVLSNEKNVI